MAMKKRYYYVDGVMICYSDENGHKDVLTDALGNITGEVDETGELTYQARYSPLGKTISSSGSSSSGFGWVGAHGYRQTGLTGASHYVRARHYSFVSGIWTTVDPRWPDEMAYGYAECNPLLLIDPTGQATCSVAPFDDCKERCEDAEFQTLFDLKNKCHKEFDACYLGLGKTSENFKKCKDLERKCHLERTWNCIIKCMHTFAWDFPKGCVHDAEHQRNIDLDKCKTDRQNCLEKAKTNKQKTLCLTRYQFCIHDAGIKFNQAVKKCAK